MFYISGNGVTAAVVSTNNRFYRSYIARTGGAFTLIDAYLTDSNSVYEHMAAIQGGVFYCVRCAFTFSSVTISYNRAYTGGVFWINEYWNTFVPFSAT
jgi:hypothetical protein